MIAFEDWKAEANAYPLLEVAARFGAALKRAGQEHIGPCPACGGSDRFSVNPGRGVWNCRGSQGGGDAISMAMHLGGLSFLQACEELAGRPNPSGRQTEPISEQEKARRAQVLADAKARERAQEAARAAYEQDTREAAMTVWGASSGLSGTVAERYLNGRGIPKPDGGWPAVLRFHPDLPYPNKQRYAALICRVDDASGDLCAVWRIFLRADGRKADVPDAKLGLGPAGGGAVRLFGTGTKGRIAIAEGVETALGYWMLTCGRAPCWAALSTSGLIGFEVPLGIERVTIVPDGDRPIKKRGHEFEPAMPAGRKAANALFTRLAGEGIRCEVAAEPPAGKDYLDLWNAHAREVA